jgi:TBC1 domain family member 13
MYIFVHQRSIRRPCLQEMQRLLFVFSKLNPGLQYVQGMNELVAPLYMVFKVDAAQPEDIAHAEADCFFCFIKLLTLSEVRDLYCKSLDRSTSGVKAVMHEYAPAPPVISAARLLQALSITDAHFAS